MSGAGRTTMPDTSPGPDATLDVQTLTLADLAPILRLGLRDFLHAPLFGLFFAAVYVAGGWFILWALTAEGAIWGTIIASLGFPLIGPFVACGLYEVSRRLEAGRPLTWSGVLGVVADQRNRQIAWIAAVIVIFFLFWNFLGHMIFALFMGLSPMTNVSSSFDIYLTANGLAMLAVGSAVGALFAFVLFALTVTSLPMLLDREVDFVTAMITSAGVVRANPRAMLVWGAIVSGTLFVAMAPWFLGLFVALPVLGHATWHLYRRALA
jgi:uncharacterized membrane protein